MSNRAGGEWDAFNKVLNYINTFEDRMIKKSAIYAAVMDMRPSYDQDGNDLADAIRPKLSKAARERIESLIEAYECGEDSQEGTDIQFLLDHHDNVHAAWDLEND
jgi:hypothetical protein